MARFRRVSRRSFLTLVTGTTTFGSFGLVSGRAAAQGCSDTDPTDPGGRGVRCANQAVTGCSDSDPSDPYNRGVRCVSRPVTGCSDNDPTDPAQGGRRCGPGDRLACVYTNCTCPGFIEGDPARGENFTYCIRSGCGHSSSYHMDTVRE
jgi:hypothetical protein